MTKEHRELARRTDDKSPVVMVTWHDARFYPDTRDGNSIIEDCHMCLFSSLGYLVRQDDTTTVIAAERNDEGEFRDVTLVPTGSIREMRRLTLGPLM